jgi:hypothetical protein
MTDLQKYGKHLNRENRLIFLLKESLKNIIIIKKKSNKTKEFKISWDLECLQIKVFLHFLGDQIFLLMGSFLFYQQDNGKNQMIHLLNFVLFFTVKIF